MEGSVGPRVLEGRVAGPLWSDVRGWEDLALLCGEEDLAVGRAKLDLDRGWSDRWSATWKVGKTKRTGPVAGLNTVSLTGCVPWRGFTWHTRQFHRRVRVSYVPAGPPTSDTNGGPGDHFLYQVDLWPSDRAHGLVIVKQGPEIWAG